MDRTPPTGLAIRRDALRRGGYEEVGNEPQEHDAADALRVQRIGRLWVERVSEANPQEGDETRPVSLL